MSRDSHNFGFSASQRRLTYIWAMKMDNSEGYMEWLEEMRSLHFRVQIQVDNIYVRPIMTCFQSHHCTEYVDFIMGNVNAFLISIWFWCIFQCLFVFWKCKCTTTSQTNEEKILSRPHTQTHAHLQSQRVISHCNLIFVWSIFRMLCVLRSNRSAILYDSYDW